MASKRQRARQMNRRNGTGLIVVAGLFLVGLAVILSLAGRKTGTTSTPVQVPDSVTPAEVSYPAPDLSLPNINGGQETLADYRDKVVLVNNWATWCPPCKREIPTLQAYFTDHQADGFVIIGIEAGETRNDVQVFVREHDMSYPVWFDLEGAATSAFRNDTLPSSYVIDRTGTVRLAWTGEISREMLEKFVTPLLAGN